MTVATKPDPTPTTDPVAETPAPAAATAVETDEERDTRVAAEQALAADVRLAALDAQEQDNYRRAHTAPPVGE